MTTPTSERAVVGVDFDDSGDDAIAEALLWLGQGPKRELHALHVIDPAQAAKDNNVQPALLAKEQALTRAPEELLHWIRQLAQLRGLPFEDRIRTHARIGKPVDTILQFAIDYDANLLIVGTHGRRGVDRLMFGSVAEKLVRGARCPVLVARPTDYGDAVKTKLPEPPYEPGQEPSYPAMRREVLFESRSLEPTSGRPTGYRIV